MNRQIIQSMLSRIILGSGAVLLLPLLLSLYYGGPVLSFLIPALLALVLSLMLRKKNISPNVSLTPREGTGHYSPFLAVRLSALRHSLHPFRHPFSP